MALPLHILLKCIVLTGAFIAFDISLVLTEGNIFSILYFVVLSGTTVAFQVIITFIDFYIIKWAIIICQDRPIM